MKNNIGSNEDALRPDPQENDFTATVPIKIELSKDYAWAAMEESSKKENELTHLAPTVMHSNKCLFVVRVTYYLQVVMMFGMLKRPIAIKLPFILKRTSERKVSMAATAQTTTASAADLDQQPAAAVDQATAESDLGDLADDKKVTTGSDV